MHWSWCSLIVEETKLLIYALSLLKARSKYFSFNSKYKTKNIQARFVLTQADKFLTMWPLFENCSTLSFLNRSYRQLKQCTFTLTDETQINIIQEHSNLIRSILITKTQKKLTFCLLLHFQLKKTRCHIWNGNRSYVKSLSNTLYC